MIIIILLENCKFKDFSAAAALPNNCSGHFCGGSGSAVALSAQKC